MVEPIQATNGIVVPPKGWLRKVSELAAKRGIPLIADEVFTGCGRTGSMFAFEAEGFVPDLLVLAKGFGGGFPAGLVAGRDDIMTKWLPGTQSSTFQLHPVSASASLAAFECIISDDLTVAARRIFRRVQEHGSRLSEFPFVGEIRGRGAMIGVEIIDEHREPAGELCRWIRADALSHGLVTWECGSEGHVIGLVPPLTIADAEIDRGMDMLASSFRRAARGRRLE